jgi:tetratricopeptide (TPR) repeat protein
MIRTLSLAFFLIPLLLRVNAQSGESRQELFDEGDYFFAREEYSEAVYYFRKLTDKYPEHCHYNFKLGECYMNIPGSESLAVKCFENAVKKTVGKKQYNPRQFDEKSAPLHAWFYLGNVYKMTGRLDDAMEAYDTFVNSPLYYGNYNITVVENEIKSCKRAKIIMGRPVDASIEALDTVINTSAAELFPVISSDEQHLVFVRRLKFYDAILWVSKKGNSWSEPINLNPIIGSDGEFYPVSLSKNGDELYLLKSTLETKDLYVSRRKNDSWTKAESLGNTINTLADETWAAVSSDGKTLWFTSGRKGGLGGLDIYYAQKKDDFSWDKAKNAGSVINTQFDEESPYLSLDDQVLFFSSKGHDNMGGFDIFYTIKSGKSWKEPVNLGYPINTTVDNTGYVPAMKGKTGYYSMVNNAFPGSSEDIYKVILKSNFPLP